MKPPRNMTIAHVVVVYRIGEQYELVVPWEMSDGECNELIKSFGKKLQEQERLARTVIQDGFDYERRK